MSAREHESAPAQACATAPFRALYLHIPFCVRRCAYCDFATQAAAFDDPLIDARLAALIHALRQAGQAGLLAGVRTVYVGGGTPSFLGAKRLGRLLRAVERAVDMEAVGEFTVEVNPESATPQVLDTLQQGGVGRVSIGVQSLDDAVLRTLGRAHDARTALRAVCHAVERFGNVSADVICGVPGQGMASLQDTVARLIDAGIVHLSAYPLTVEPDTPLARAVRQGQMPDVDDDVQADHLELVRALALDAGFEHYEVASYARPGFASKHNTAYWTGVPYLGLGDGAASMLAAGGFGQLRQAGLFEGLPGQVPQGCARVRLAARAFEPAEVEMLDGSEAAREDAMLGMRMAQGIGGARWAMLTKAEPALRHAEMRVVGLGLAEWRDGRLVPTRKGWLMGNELYGALWNSLS